MGATTGAVLDGSRTAVQGAALTSSEGNRPPAWPYWPRASNDSAPVYQMLAVCAWQRSVRVLKSMRRDCRIPKAFFFDP